jgi:glycosyltransferase involved in cell wall biosynthesis
MAEETGGTGALRAGCGAPRRLGVVLPNYNHGHCIARALEALLAQDRPPDEIVIVDDASMDRSIDVIEGFISRSAPIRLLRNEVNQGVARSLQRGLLASEAEYVYFAASDDWVLPGFFSLALDVLARHPDAGFFCGDALLIDAATGGFYGYRPAVRPRYRSGRLGCEEVAGLLRTADNWILTGSSVFRRELAVAEGGFAADLDSFADGFLARKIALRHGCCYAPAAVAAWCVSQDSVSRRNARGAQKALALLETVRGRIAADPVFPAWYADKFESRWRFATLRLAMEETEPDADFIASMGAGSGADRVLMRSLSGLPGARVRRLAALAWFWYRWRPYRLIDLAGTVASRWLQGAPGRTRGGLPGKSP